MNVSRCLTSAVLSIGLAYPLSAQNLHLDFSPSILRTIAERNAKDQTTLLCRRCETAPTIDGRMNDAAWQAATKIDRFSRGRPATEAWVCFDGGNLYIAAVCAELPGRAPVGQERDRDDKVWSDDCIEIWVDPVPNDGESYQFAVNIAGSIYDSKIRGGGSETGHNPDWSRAVHREQDRWILELAIPCAALGLKGWYRELRFNIGRNGPGLGPRSWNARYGSTVESALVLDGAPKLPLTRRDEVVRSTANLAVEGESLSVKIDRPYARPGDRYVLAKLAFRPKTVSLEGSRLEVKLFRLADPKPVDELSAVPERGEADLLIDLRSKNLGRAELSLELFEGDQRTGAAKALLHSVPCDKPVEPRRRIGLTVDVPEGVEVDRQWPITFGVPFAEGTLWDAGRLRLVDADGTEIPCQKEVTGRWSKDGAIQWVRFDAWAPSAKACFVEVAESGKPALPESPVRLTERGNDVIVETGNVRYVLSKGGSPIREVWLAGKRVAASAGTRGLYVVDQKGQVARASADGETMLIEARGPVASCVRFEGFYRTSDGTQLARHITRVECRAGQPSASVTHTLVLTHDTNEVWFREIGWELAVDAGAEPRATFGVSADQHEKHASYELSEGAQSAHMIQDSHFHFAHGTNHFSVATVAEDGQPTTKLEGEECGDWGALVGDTAGFEIGCRDAAKQHPKEFGVFRDRVVLKLFSNRAGEELDFRSPALVKKWDLPTWYEKSVPASQKKKDYIKRAREFKSNAIGWAKTHQLLFQPLAPGNAVRSAGVASRLHRHPVYAHVDPWWIYETGAMGPLYPRDPKRFPEIEEAVESAAEWWIAKDREWGEYGFVDYFAGPHLSYRGKYAGIYRYCYVTYTLRTNLWLVYARSGNRALREFVEGTTRTHLDGNHAHWEPDAPNRRRGIVKGLFRSEPAYFELPFYWGSAARMEISSSTNFNNYLWFYHLSGYRRAKDCVEQYAEGIKRAWSPAAAARTSRIIALLRLLVQCYGLTGDHELYDLAEATTDLFEDREGDLLLTKDRSYKSSSYKTQVDIRGLIDAWHILGNSRYRDLAVTIAKHWWNQQLGTSGFGYNVPMAVIGNFLYEQTGDPVYAQSLAVSARHNVSFYDPETGTFPPRTIDGSHSTSFTFESSSALDVIARTSADQRNAASWIGYDDAGSQTSVVVQKPTYSAVDLYYKTPAPLAKPHTLGATGGVRVEPIAPKDHWGQDLNRVTEASTGQGVVRIPKDAPAGAYRVTFPMTGTHYVFASERVPLVVHAPEYWLPSPPQVPPQRYYFRVPKDGKDCQVFFEGKAKLIDPSGAAFRDGGLFTGWVDLPADQPGVWAFEQAESKFVRVRNLPPFFAVGDRASYFTPDVAWEREAIPSEAEEISPDTVYVPGAISTPDNKALYLTGKRYLTIDAGADHPSGDGTLFMPHKQGTIEFFFKPNWDSVTVGDGDRSFCYGRMKVPGGGNYYVINYKKKGRNNDVSAFLTEKAHYGPRGVRTYRYQSLFSRNRWAHVAWAWGERSVVFVDGKRGRQRVGVLQEPAFAAMSSFVVGHTRPVSNTNGFIDELRISDAVRYKEDFTPPSRDRELALDEHTRSLFHFNGNLDCESYGHDEKPKTKLTRP